MILRQKNNQVLIKNQEILKLGNTEIPVIEYEWWTDLEKMRERIFEESKDGQHFVYCRMLLGTDIREEELVKEFDSQIN